jgi:hypothetical protein
MAAPAPDQVAADSGNRFDVLVVYTAAARMAAGSTAAMQALINLGVAETNQAYANSGIIPRLRLVHIPICRGCVRRRTASWTACMPCAISTARTW